MGKFGLVLSGGGARGAYQAGAIKALEEILKPRDHFPFEIICGVSAGSINAAALATNAHDFSQAARILEKLWGQLEADQVIRTNLSSLGRISATWLRDLSLGGALGAGNARSLLDTAPLRELLSRAYDPVQTKANIENKHFQALAISATNIYTINSVTFVQAAPEQELWARHKRLAERTDIRVDHLMASSAIPVFFPSVEIEGRHFTDGCIGNISPLSPAVHLGADKIIGIGVRNMQMESETSQGPREIPSMAHLVGLLMNTVFMDSIEIDLQRMNRINEILSKATPSADNANHWKPIQSLQISPSEKISDIAKGYIRNMPRVVRYFMKGLGDQRSINEVASYLLFDASFCSRLLELGYNDTIRIKSQVEAFFA